MRKRKCTFKLILSGAQKRSGRGAFFCLNPQNNQITPCYGPAQDTPSGHRHPAESRRAPADLNRRPCRFALQVFAPVLRFESCTLGKKKDHPRGGPILIAGAGHSLWSSASCRIPTGACGPKSASLPICAPSIRAGPPFRVLHTGQKKDHPRGGPILIAGAGHSLWSSASCRIPTGACGPKSASLPICAPSIRAGPPFRVLRTGQKKDHPRGGPILIAGAGHSLWSSASCRFPTGACGPKSASLPICAPSIRAGPPFRVLHTGQKKDHPRGGPILIAGAGLEPATFGL
jgi:hypothetical protein